MKKWMMALALLMASQAHAAMDQAMGLALAQKSGCLGCHAVDKKEAGPAFREVAAKYKAERNAAARLIYKIKVGGSGVWGDKVMPPSAVSDADIKELAERVLAQ